VRNIKEDLIKIAQTERGLLALIVLNFLLSLILAIFAIVNLNPNSLVTKVGYGDIGGYREGPWSTQFAYVIAAIVFGVLHGLLTTRVFRKRGSGMAKFFLITTTMLIFGTFIVLIRLLREG
jgi:hypothetical protein